MAKLPSEQITRGWISSICRNRWPSQASISTGCGIPVAGRPALEHVGDEALPCASSPISASSWSSSLPARPTNGLPCLSSLNPGASPTNIRSASGSPVPNTTVSCGPRPAGTSGSRTARGRRRRARRGGRRSQWQPQDPPQHPPPAAGLRHRLRDGRCRRGVTDRTLNADISRAVRREPHSGQSADGAAARTSSSKRWSQSRQANS